MSTSYSRGPADQDLIAAVRAGNRDAADSLFRRHHGAATAFAVTLAGEPLAHDLVSEAFTKIFALMLSGRGPDLALRPYLLTVIRRVHVDHIRRTQGEVPVEDLTDLPNAPKASSTETLFDARFESSMIARAFKALPKRWQEVLWHTQVEDEPLQQVAQILGMNANSVAALSFRAREGLRAAYLAEHLDRTSDPMCRATLEKLPKHARRTLRGRPAEAVVAHLNECAQCAAALIDLTAINSSLGAVLAPALLGGGLTAPTMALFTHPANDDVELGVSATRNRAVAAAATVAVGVVGLAVLWATATNDGAADNADRTVPEAMPTPATPATPHTSPPTHTPKQRRSSEAQPLATRPPASTPSTVQDPTPPPTPLPSMPESLTTPTPRLPVVDAALGRPTHEQITTTEPPWFHVEFPVHAAGQPLTMRVRLTGAAEYQVHTDHQFGNWACTQVGRAVPDVTLDCTIAEDSDRTQHFAIDAQPTSTATITIKVKLASGRDPDGSNNSRSTTIGAG